MAKITHRLVFVAAAAILMSSPGWAADKPTTSSVVILKSTTTGDGVPLVYPKGTPQITSRITTFPPGAETHLHRHPVPLYAYIMEGELTLHTEGQPVRRFKAGEAFMETSQWHIGRNETDKPLKLLSVYAGSVDLPLAEYKQPSN